MSRRRRWFAALVPCRPTSTRPSRSPRSHFGLSLALIGLVVVGCQSSEKSYMRHPLVKEMRVTTEPVSQPEQATQAEPYPPPRPNIPNEPWNTASASVVRTPEFTPAN